MKGQKDTRTTEVQNNYPGGYCCTSLTLTLCTCFFFPPRQKKKKSASWIVLGERGGNGFKITEEGKVCRLRTVFPPSKKKTHTKKKVYSSKVS